MDTRDRRNEARRVRLCFNCLGPHAYSLCTSNRRCSICQDKHQVLLHIEKTERSKNSKANKQLENSETDITTNSVTALTAKTSCHSRVILLATAQVLLVNPGGKHMKARALLDQGAEASFLTESVVQLLGLKKQRLEVNLTGIGESSSIVSKSKIEAQLRSVHYPEFGIDVEALVLPRLTSQLPDREIFSGQFDLFEGLTLADSRFYCSDTVDIILGADVYGSLLKEGVRHFPPSRLVAQHTWLGWIISGPVDVHSSRRAVDNNTKHNVAYVFHCSIEDSLGQLLQKFWEIEEVPDKGSRLKPEKEICENLFNSTFSRTKEGRFIVRLPLKAEVPKAATETRGMALRALASLHRRFGRDNQLANAYREFMITYEQLGHMERIPVTELANPNAWYLPHHPVIKRSPWKLRVVFDASRQTSEQLSLNKLLHIGPALQKDLALVLTNWRKYRYVFFWGDIIKMFRQVIVHPADRDLQRILWKVNTEDTPIEYRLTTVTYGTSCAPYLAIRVLLQLAQDDKIFPIAEAIEKRDELIKLLQTAGMELDKWTANDNALLPAMDSQFAEIKKTIEQIDGIKTLGVQWLPMLDTFKFDSSSLQCFEHPPTKRTVLSIIARLFDPLGWMSPFTIIAKILMQDLWLLKCDWDTPLPIEAMARWQDYQKMLLLVSDISIKRPLRMSITSDCEIHGFSDASKRAYAAAVYLRGRGEGNHYRVSLLMAKCKVSPVKTVSVPNLELMGANLLIKLIRYLQNLTWLKDIPIFTWFDSQIVLAWLRKHSSSWKTFVANRSWRLWWSGPAWLSQSSQEWPETPQKVKSLLAHSFKTEFGLLEQRKFLPKNSKLSSLNPFFDEQDKILRVGGRLIQSSLGREAKHPPICVKIRT
ncbi:uncharacterized protein [Prorops nasuta]|uniref:uncharacterized protein n=1 Tax=Prorops nasuta TaxID=863751 RepID=UPI0034CFEBDA